MVNVVIEREALFSSANLKQVLEERLTSVRYSNEAIEESSGSIKSRPSETCFVCSKSFLDAQGGQSSLVEKAKNHKASYIIIVQEKSDEFCVKEDLGGKLLHVQFPEQEDSLNLSKEYGIQLLATLITRNNQFIAGDEITKKLVRLAEKVAQTDVTVFINGPTGTGKEVLSKFIHNQSSRHTHPFVGINCAAIPENMLEAILFGHEKGAFTGASNPNKGIFRAADGGTLLLDEISEMPLALQAKLLRVLQEKIVTPIGSQKELEVDVRVIATTNRNMSEEIAKGTFREDLYYRLNVFPLATSHLIERKNDIIPLTTAFLYRHCRSYNELPWLDSPALETLLNHSWPGNVRELENIVQRALVLCTEKQICSSDIVIDNNPLNVSQVSSLNSKKQQIAI